MALLAEVGLLAPLDPATKATVAGSDVEPHRAPGHQVVPDAGPVKLGKTLLGRRRWHYRPKSGCSRRSTQPRKRLGLVIFACVGIVALDSACMDADRVHGSTMSQLDLRTNAERPRIFFDCTATLRDGLNTGIQRVVRNLIVHAEVSSRRLGIECRPVLHSQGVWRYAPLSLTTDTPPAAPPTVWQRRRQQSVDFALWLRHRVRKALVPKKIYLFVQKRQKLWEIAFRHKRVRFRAEDILLLPDVGWSQAEPAPFEPVRRAGGSVGFVSYDLIPVRFPGFQIDGFPEVFESWLRSTLEQVDFAVAISQAVRDDLNAFLADEGGLYRHLHGRVGWFPLGASLDMANSAAPVRESLRVVFERENCPPPLLTVCTLEPRKNHTLLLDMFDSLRAELPDLRLCFVGRAGWCFDQLVARLQGHPDWQRRLFWFSDLSDSELAYAYRRARTFVFPSFAEGFGLPIVEALHYGLSVLASDIPVHREVGAEHCRYFAPHDQETLANLVRDELSRHLQAKDVVPRAKVTDWSESSIRLWQECLRLGRTRFANQEFPVLDEPTCGAHSSESGAVADAQKKAAA